MAIIYGRIERKLSSKPPKKVTSMDDLDKVHHEIRKDIREELASKLAGIKKSSKKQISKPENNNSLVTSSNPIDVLSQLSDKYHILCGVNITLPNDITYHGKKDLNSAAIDFVVISKKGIVLIGVKNENLSHEQVDRDTRVLKSHLKSWRAPQNPKVTSVILSVKGNVKNNPKYKSVTTSNLKKINSFLESGKEIFSDKELKRIFDRLEGHVTN